MADERVVVGGGSKYQLEGILTLPDGANALHPVPAVVLVHGSGPSNMDEHIGNNAPFRDLANGLSRRGIAVLRYDKRTFVYGKQMKDDTGLSVREETIEDAILAAKLLRQDTRIRSDGIVIGGHSLGGMLAPRIDSEGGDFCGIIIMAGSPRKLEEIIMDQNAKAVKSLNRLLRAIAKKQMAKLSATFENTYRLTDEEAKRTKALGRNATLYYFKEMGEHPSLDYLTALHKPVLILQGDKDFQVSIDEDFEGYRTALGHMQNVAFKRYANLNHLFMQSIYGDILKARKEYKVPQHVAEEVIADIADWILSNVGE